MSKEIAINAKPQEYENTKLNLGPQLTDFEITEVRIWAAVRSQEQISDMKENYLCMAENKKKIKVAIHQVRYVLYWLNF